MLQRVNVQEPQGAAGIVPKRSLSSRPGWVLAACSRGPGCRAGSQCSSAKDKQQGEAGLGTLSPQQGLSSLSGSCTQQIQTPAASVGST